MTFASGGGGLLPWVCLLVTHSLETVFWWSLALHPSFNTKSLGVAKLAIEAISFKLPGAADTFILLIVVPLLVAIFTVLGPNPV